MKQHVEPQIPLKFKYGIAQRVGLLIIATLVGMSSNCLGQELHFSEAVPSYGLNFLPNTAVYKGHSELFDIDNDGDLDAIINGSYGFQQPGVTEMYSNDGEGNFVLIPETNIPGLLYGDISIADIDNDGDIDYLITGSIEEGFSSTPHSLLYLNNGVGGFTLAPNSALEPMHNGVHSFADLDGDGDQDLILAGVSASASNNTLIYINDGAGNFTESDHAMVNIRECDIAIEDMDNDNDLDLLISGVSENNNESVCILYSNDGAANFVEAVQFPYPTIRAVSLAVSDFDENGHPDFIISGWDMNNDYNDLHLNNGDGSYTMVNSPFSYGLIDLIDVDGDLDKDVLITGKTEGFESDFRSDLYINNGGGDYDLNPGSGLIPFAFCAVAHGDVDNDESEDILLVGSDSWEVQKSKLFFNDGAGYFSDGELIHLDPLGLSEAAFADVDGDDDLDILIAGFTGDGNETALYMNNGQGIYTKQESTGLDHVQHPAFDFADVDGDDDLDLMITGRTTIGRITKLYTNDGLGNFEFSANFPSLDYGDVEFEDIDEDGDFDLMICGGLDEFSSNCKLYKNDGAGTFTLVSSPFENYGDAAHDYSGTDINFFDIDNDGDKDLVLSNWYEFLFTVTDIFLNDGTGVFTYGSSPFEGVLFGEIDYADIDNDGDIDVMVTGQSLQIDSSPYVCKLYINDGLGNFSPSSQTFETSNDTSILFTDLDGDGDQDILMGGYFDPANTSQYTRLYLNDGSGSFSAIDNPFQSCYIGDIAVGDIDGDDDLDVLITGQSEGGRATKLWRNGACLYEGFDNTTICANESVTINGNVYDAVNRQGAEYFAGGAADGCDSLVVVYLDIISPPDFDVSTDNANISVNSTLESYQWYDCDNGFALISGADSFEFVAPQNGNYAVEVTDAQGCVSISQCITTFDCTVEIIESTVDSTLCAGDSLIINGTVYNADNSAGVEVFEGVTTNGCDSTLIVNLDFLAEIDTIVGRLQDTVLVATGGYDSYQWLNCNDGMSIIENASDTAFSPLETGSYAVQISNANCMATSNCHVVIIPEPEIEEPPVGVFPNPSEGGISVQFETVHESLEVVILSTFGGEVHSQTFFDTNQVEIDLNVPAGMYIMEITDSLGGLHTYQFMII